MYFLWQFGSLQLPRYNASDDISTAEPRTAYSNLPSGGRIDQYSIARLPLGGMSVTTTFLVYGETPQLLDQALLALRRLDGVRDSLVRRRDYDQSLQFTTARCMGPKITRRFPENRCFVEVSMTFETEQPYFRDIEGLIWSLDETPPRTLDSGLTLDAGVNVYNITSLPTNLAVNVTGSDMEIRNGEITFTTAGSLTWLTPKITNIRNNMSFQYNGSIAPGSELRVNFDDRGVYLNGAPVYNAFQYGSEQIDWMVLEIGSNTLQVGGVFQGTGTAQLLHRWENVYL